VPDWPVYVALGDSLTAGRDDPGPGGGRIGWARRLAGLLTTRTSVPCTLTNLATDGAGVAAVLERQLPALAGIGPDLVSVTVGMNDIRDPASPRIVSRPAWALCSTIWRRPGRRC
jgi:lysophospholipase L1-like esterase